MTSVPDETWRSAVEAALQIALDHVGSAKRRRLARRIEANSAILNEERGEDIASAVIAGRIRALLGPAG